MKKSFYLGLALLALFEAVRVYLIMPMPGSQGAVRAEFSHSMHAWRWAIRILCGLLIVVGIPAIHRARRRWLPATAVLATGLLVWSFNFVMSADRIFHLPAHLSFATRGDDRIPQDAMVLGVEIHGEAKAYPIRYLVYHHQIPDTIGGVPVLVTYCSVCRTGRVFDPVVNGRVESFRLVGMDRWNAMFEDATTGSWWQQATGRAVSGPLARQALAEIPSAQLTAREWFGLHAASRIMLADEDSTEGYDLDGVYERGESTSELTGTDHGSWNDKSWVVGVETGGASRAYDWNRLKQVRVISDAVGGTPIVIALLDDQQSFVVFERPAGAGPFALDGKTLVGGDRRFDLAGRDLADPAQRLRLLPASQEFWHSWRTFHPATSRDSSANS